MMTNFHYTIKSFFVSLSHLDGITCDFLILFYSLFCVQGAENELKHAVAFVRPVSVAFQVVNGFHFYENGVYTSDICGSTSQVSSINDYLAFDSQIKCLIKFSKQNGLLQVYAL